MQADVAVKFTNQHQTCGGVYVGRREWPGSTVPHHSLAWFGVGPRYAPNKAVKYELGALGELYWWERDQGGSHNTHEEKRSRWSADDKIDGPRFARVVIEVSAAEIRGAVDGHAFKPMTTSAMSAQLARDVASRILFPRYEFRESPIGPGIGIFCQDGECAVLNLTVSKLNP